MLIWTMAALAALPSGCERAAAAAAEPACVERRLAGLATSLPDRVEEAAENGLERSPDDVKAWQAAAAETLRAWTAYRDARCDATLLRFEGAGESADACRLRVGRTILADLAARYGAQPGGFGRADVETLAAAPRKSPEDEGPCAKVEPAECDYCAMNHCWEKRLKADDAALNAAWRGALARIAGKAGLSPSRRADWTERLRKAQRLWLRWRDEDCALERLETPNPNAHSIYALITGPCLAAETEARTQVLRRTYRR